MTNGNVNIILPALKVSVTAKSHMAFAVHHLKRRPYLRELVGRAVIWTGAPLPKRQMNLTEIRPTNQIFI